MRINIVGAGIMGATLAYELGRRGHVVTVIEAEKFGRATSAAAGMICPWITKRRNKKWYQLARGGARYHPELVASLVTRGGQGVDFQRNGAIKLDASEAKITEFYEIGLRKRVDAPEIGALEILSPDQVREKFPGLATDYYGLWIEGGGRIRGEALRQALLNVSVANFDASVVYGEARVDSVGQVHMDGAVLPGDLTIMANGVWMAESFADDFPEPIYFQKGELVHLQHDGLADDAPVLMPPNGVYLLPFSDGRLVVGATHENVDNLDATFSPAAGEKLVEKAMEIAPGLAGARVIEEHIGYRPFTEGHLPKFGYLNGDRRLLYVNGLGSSGLTVAPYIARELAKLIDGAPAEINWADYA